MTQEETLKLLKEAIMHTKEITRLWVEFGERMEKSRVVKIVGINKQASSQK